MFRSVSIGTRISGLMLLMFLCLVLLLGTHMVVSNLLQQGALDEASKAMLEGEKARLRLATHTAAGTIAKAVQGIQSVDERLAIMRAMVDDIRFERDASGYFFIYQGTVVVTVPPLKERQGKDLNEAHDANKVYFVRELAKAAQAGGGFVSYVFPKPPVKDVQVAKLAYAEMIPGTDVWIGTGIYLDNIDAEQARIDAALSRISDKALIILLSVVGAMLLVVVVPLSVAVIRSLIGPLREATGIAVRVAEGSLDQAINVVGRDEISQLSEALSTMVRTIKLRVADAEHQAEKARIQSNEVAKALEHANLAKEQADAGQQALHAAAGEMDQLVEQLVSVATELTARMEQAKYSVMSQRDRVANSATAMEEMNATVLEVAKSASQASQRSEASRERAADGAHVVQQSIHALSVLGEDTRALHREMQQLGDQANSIGAIITVINDIADQTNLLALNAAIEAARAGEAGRGFAVVADEVRKLAEKTMEATRQVGAAISGIQAGTGRSIDAMSQASTRVQEATEFAGKSGEALKGIVEEAVAAADQVRNIATAAEEQSAASNEIAASLEEINNLSDETTAIMEVSASVVHSLSQESAQLEELIKKMRTV